MFNRKANQIEQLRDEVLVALDDNKTLESERIEFTRTQKYLAEEALGKVHDLTFKQYGGLPSLENSSSEYNLSKLLPRPRSHTPGKLLAIRFTDAAFFQFTTEAGLSDRLHTFKLTSKPQLTEYRRAAFNTDSQAIESSPVATSDLDEMLVDPRFIATLGSFTTHVEFSSSNSWKNRIGEKALNRALNAPTDKLEP